MSLVWWARNAQTPVGPVAPSDRLSVADPSPPENRLQMFLDFVDCLQRSRLRFTAAYVAAQEGPSRLMTPREAVHAENCAHCHKATGQGGGGAAPAHAG